MTEHSVSELINWFPNIQITESLQKKNEDKINMKSVLQEANISSRIPARFYYKCFGDYEETNIAREVKDFSILKDNDKVFILMGTTGVGKTTLMAEAIHERAINGMNPGYYFSLRDLPAMLRSSRNFNSKESEIELIERFGTISFLCLDEYGTSEDTTLERNFIRTVLAKRYDNMLPTFIATNCDWDNLKFLLTGTTSKETQDKDPILDRLKATSIRRGINNASYRSAS